MGQQNHQRSLSEWCISGFAYSSLSSTHRARGLGDVRGVQALWWGGVEALAQQLWVEVNPLDHLLWHAEHRIHCLHLVIPQEGQSCHTKQGVERVHLE